MYLSMILTLDNDMFDRELRWRLNPITAYDINLDKYDIFDEEDEDDVLEICFNMVVRDRDFSPRQ